MLRPNASRRGWAAWIAGLALAATGAAAPSAPTPERADAAEAERLVARALAASGTDLDIADISATVTGRAEAGPGPGAGIPSEDVALLVAEVRDAYAVEKLYRDVVAVFLRDFDRGLTLQVLEWLERPVARKLLERSKRDAGPDRQERFVAYAEQLAREPGPPERRALVQRIVRESGATEAFVAALAGSNGAMLRGLNGLLPPGRQAPPEVLEAALARAREGIAAAAPELVLASAHYELRELDRDELGAYSAFLESPAGRWWSATQNEAMVEALTAAGARTGAGLAAYVRQRGEAADAGR